MSSGPIALFDKSFIQSLSVDESVWFDNFYLPVVCPIFYAETLADLSKDTKGKRHPEEEVKRIAEKFPEMGGTPCLGHHELCLGNLHGHHLPMNGQIVVPGGRPILDRGKTGFVIDKFSEVEAFNRWQQQDFHYIEQNFARFWRHSVTTLDLKEQAKIFQSLGITGKTCKTLADAKNLADTLLAAMSAHNQMKLAVHFFGIAREYHQSIMRNWAMMNYQPIHVYAPYAAFVLGIELFFQVAIAANLISTDRPSNRIDISYLFYLPFCMMFVSSDKLHMKCAPLFLREDQSFVWGQDLKKDLSLLNKRYMDLPDKIKELGVLSFAHTPPNDDDRHMGADWRTGDEIVDKMPEKNEKLVEMMNKIKELPTIHPEKIDYDDINSMTLSRYLKKRKGSWYQINKDIESEKS